MALTRKPPVGAEHGRSREHLDSRAARGVGEGARGLGAQIGNRRDRDPGGLQIKGRLIGIVAGCDDDDACAGPHGIAIEVRLCRARQQNSGRSLPGNTSGRSMAPVASTTAPCAHLP